MTPALERAFEDANEPFDYAVYMAADGWFVHVPWGEDASEPQADHDPRAQAVRGLPDRR